MATISSLVVSEMANQKSEAEDADTPTTPRASRFPINAAADHPSMPMQIPAKKDTSTMLNYVPTQDETERPRPGTSGSTATSDAMDIDEPEGDNDDSDGEEEEGDGDGDSASRKKKGQRFFCTGYPPCNLSFTRSEHLARHIRKHTGERPFQCHCNRRFSRLDNLRQHAQTVHVNEEIPTDSLAATGTRFQRQIRTDRVRQGPRPRSGTMGSTGSHSRGHSRNLSASSIGSTSSNYSTVGESKRRPPPLLMASDASRPKLGLEPPSTPPPQYHGMGPHSPGGLSTPTSATWSAAPGSPGLGSSIGSPMSSVSRLTGPYGINTPGRRLSVPSGPNPYQQQYANTYPYPSYQNPMGPPSSNVSGHPSVYASPTSSTFSFGPSYPGPPGEDWRRRTWHPSTYTNAHYGYGRPATSGLSFSQTPDAPQPAYAQHATSAASQAPRLPGIESFDHVQHRPSTPPRRQRSPMQNDTSPTQGMKSSSYPELDDQGQVAKPSSWSQQALEEIHGASGQPGVAGRAMEMGPPPPMTASHHQQIAQEALQVHSSARRSKRHGWYNGAPAGARTSPEDSSSSDGVPTPGTSAVDVHPIIMPSGGSMDYQHAMMAPEPQQSACLGPPAQITSPYAERSERERTTSFGERSSNGGDMNRLEALVAVATSGEATAAR